MNERSTAGVWVLSPEVRKRIAAGEVIERPASVVKELIENAIDAGARVVTVEAWGGGMSLIRVTDDGCGIARADAGLALERFSTSKIRSPADLERIRTLGFRGEALSSIAAVARVEVLTRARHEAEGTRVLAFEGEVHVEPAATPVGTSVTVRDLFAHLPARRRFLKSLTRESELIRERVARYALVYPQISFRLILDGRERLNAPVGSLRTRIGNVWGHEVAGEMLPVEWKALDLRISGFIGRTTMARARRDRQVFAVNGRPVRPGLMAVMLERPYAGRLPAGRRPLAVIHVSIAPELVDVNVHPRKAEVRFAQERAVYNAIAGAVSLALRDESQKADAVAVVWPAFDRRPSVVAESSAPYEAGGPRVLAQLNNTYILAQTPDGLIVVDQHAAHEQVLFEQLVQGTERVQLSPPSLVELTYREAQSLERLASLLGDLGVEVEPFGGRSFLVRTLPVPLRGHDPIDLLTDLLAAEPRWPDDGHVRRELAAAGLACRGAVKAGDRLSLDEMQQLLDDLWRSWSPATCPHGRPAMIAISMEELARRFGR